MTQVMTAAGAAEIQIAGPDPVTMTIARWILSIPSPRSREAYAVDLGYRYRELPGGRYDLHRPPTDRGWLPFLDGLGVPLAEATEDHVNLWRDRMRQEDAPESSIARRLSTVSSLYTWMLRHRMIAEHPVTNVNRPKLDKDESSTMGPTKDQALAILKRARERGPRDYALVSLLLFTGLRITEAVAADVESLREDKGHKVIVVLRKGRREAKVVVPPPAWSALTSYLDGRTTGPLFLAETGRLTRQRATGVVMTIGWQAGVSDKPGAGRDEIARKGLLTAHSLRHGFATLSLDAGATLTEVQDDMGHKDPRTTRRYDRARHRHERASGYKLAAFLAEGEDAHE